MVRCPCGHGGAVPAALTSAIATIRHTAGEFAELLSEVPMSTPTSARRCSAAGQTVTHDGYSEYLRRKRAQKAVFAAALAEAELTLPAVVRNELARLRRVNRELRLRVAQLLAKLDDATERQP